jgi:hypothetical protein
VAFFRVCVCSVCVLCVCMGVFETISFHSCASLELDPFQYSGLRERCKEEECGISMVPSSATACASRGMCGRLVAWKLRESSFRLDACTYFLSCRVLPCCVSVSCMCHVFFVSVVCKR